MIELYTTMNRGRHKSSNISFKYLTNEQLLKKLEEMNNIKTDCKKFIEQCVIYSKYNIKK